MSSLTFAVGGILDGDSEVLTIGGADFTLGTADTQTVTVGGTTFQVVYDGAGGFTITDNGGGHMPLADVELLLAGYQNTSDDPTDGDRTIGITVTDPSGDSATATTRSTSIRSTTRRHWISTAGRPELQHGLHRKRYAGQHQRRCGGPERPGRGRHPRRGQRSAHHRRRRFSLGTADTQTMTVGGTTFQVVYDGAGGFAISDNGGGDMPLADIESLLAGTTYQNTSDDPSDGDRTIAITVTDPSGASAAATSTVNVDPVNDGHGGGDMPLADVELLLAGTTYQNTSDDPTDGDRTIGITVTDPSGDSATATSTVNVDPVNDPPALDLNGAGAGTDFSTAYTENGTPVSITDGAVNLSDLDDTAMSSLTFAVGGILDGDSEVLSIGGVDFALGTADTQTVTVGGTTFQVVYDGAGGFTITDNGGGDMPLADVELLLAGTTYQNTSDDPTDGDRTIGITVTDPSGDSATATSTVNVDPVNDPPALDLNGAGAGTEFSTAYTENGTPVSITDGAVDLSDLDDTAMSSLTFAVGGILDGDSEVLTIGGADFTLGTADTQTVTVGGTTFQVVYDGAGGFTITDNGGGHMPLADVELLLAGTTYQNTSDDPTDGDRTIGITVTDPSGDSATATSTVNVDPVNDAPALDLNGGAAGDDYSTAYTENGTPVSITDGAVDLSDLDDTAISSLTFAVGGILDGDSEVLTIGGTDFTLGTSDTQTVAVGGTTFQVVYDGAGGFAISDDGGGDMPLADVELLLAGTTYQNTSDDPSDGDRAIAITVTDPAGASASATNTVNVDPVNDGPALDLNGAAAGTDFATTYIEDAAPVNIVDGAVDLSDLDDTAMSSLGFSVAGILDGDSEVLTIGGFDFSLGTADTQTVTVGGTTFQVVYDGAGGFSISDNGGGDMPLADIELLLAGTTYQNTSDDPSDGVRTIGITVSDPTGASASATSTVNVDPVNDGPALDLNGAAAGTDFATTYTEDAAPVNIADGAVDLSDLDDTAISSLSFSVAGILDGDSEVLTIGGVDFSLGTADTQTVTVGGTTFQVVYDGAGGFAISDNGGGDMPLADVESLLAGTTYQNTSDDPSDGDRTIAITVTDPSGASAAATSTVNVDPVNDGPALDLNGAAAGNDFATTYTEDAAPVNITDGAVDLSDLDDTAMSSLSFSVGGILDGDSEVLTIGGRRF